MEWQDISTAPRNNEEVLICTGMGMFVARWQFEDKWYPDGLPFVTPTHWMPLPPPPQDKTP